MEEKKIKARRGWQDNDGWWHDEICDAYIDENGVYIWRRDNDGWYVKCYVGWEVVEE